MSTTDIRISDVTVGDLRIQYRELGEGPPVLLVHGWPTSSFLWRNIMPAIATHCRVLAIDMPGFGGSDKPVDCDYDEDFFNAAFDGFIDALGIDEPIGLAVHDAGGPFALYWASQRPRCCPNWPSSTPSSIPRCPCRSEPLWRPAAPRGWEPSSAVNGPFARPCATASRIPNDSAPRSTRG